jgi:acyl carrier protein
MAMSDDLEERLRKILVEQLDYRLGADRVRHDTSLYGKGLGLSSLDAVALVVRLEDEFDVFFEPEEFTEILATFGSLLSAVRRKVGSST